MKFTCPASLPTIRYCGSKIAYDPLTTFVFVLGHVVSNPYNDNVRSKESTGMNEKEYEHYLEATKVVDINGFNYFDKKTQGNIEKRFKEMYPTKTIVVESSFF